jgi:hypothetical protein
VECKLPIPTSEGHKGNREIEKDMNVAERSAFHNTSSTFSYLHSVILLGVMGILLAVALRLSAPATALLIGLSLFIVGMLVPARFLQLRRFSVFPSLLPVTTCRRPSVRRLRVRAVVPDRKDNPVEGSSL